MTLASILFRHCNQYVSEIDRTMVSLDHNGSGFALTAVEGSSRDARNYLIADNCFTVYGQGDEPANESHIVGLPFSRVLCHHFSRGEKPIDRSKIVPGRFHAF